MQARILAPVCRTHGSAPGSARTSRPAPRSRCHASCVSVANSWRSDGAPPARWIRDHARRQLARFDQPRVHAVHADRSRLVRGVPGEPDASFAEAPRQAALEQAERRPVNLRRPRRAPGSPRGDQLLEPLHRWRVFRGVPDLESPAASPLLEGPVDARQVWIENDAHFRGKLPRRLDLVDGEDLARAMLLHLDAGHPPHGRVVPVGADHIGRSDRLASHDDPLASRDGVAGRDLVELRDLRPEGRAVHREGLEPVSPEDLELLPAERLLRGPLQQALADDEEIRMLGSEGRIVDLGAPLPPFVVGDLRQLPPRADQPFGESCLVENPERARMDRERVAVLGRPLVHVDDLHTDPVLLQEQGRDETDRTGADDEDLRIGVTEHRASSSRALSQDCGRSASFSTITTPIPARGRWTRSPQTRRC